MTSIKLILLSLILLALCQCLDKSEIFSTYSVDPMREAFVKNNIAAYVECIIVSDTVAKADSVSFDGRGNIISVIMIDGFKSEEFFTYDSLNRLVHRTELSDIHTEICTRYEPHPIDKEVTKYTYHCEPPDSSLLRTEIIKYDDRLEKILQSLEISPSNDSTSTFYVYDGKRLIKELVERNGHKGRETSYFYLDGQLIRINRTLPKAFDDDDFISKTTGLIDSTIIRSPDDTTVIYYKYYKNNGF